MHVASSAGRPIFEKGLFSEQQSDISKAFLSIHGL